MGVGRDVSGASVYSRSDASRDDGSASRPERCRTKVQALGRPGDVRRSFFLGGQGRGAGGGGWGCVP